LLRLILTFDTAFMYRLLLNDMPCLLGSLFSLDKLSVYTCTSEFFILVRVVIISKNYRRNSTTNSFDTRKPI